MASGPPQATPLGGPVPIRVAAVGHIRPAHLSCCLLGAFTWARHLRSSRPAKIERSRDGAEVRPRSPGGHPGGPGERRSQALQGQTPRVPGQGGLQQHPQKAAAGCRRPGSLRSPDQLLHRRLRRGGDGRGAGSHQLQAAGGQAHPKRIRGKGASSFL